MKFINENLFGLGLAFLLYAVVHLFQVTLPRSAESLPFFLYRYINLSWLKKYILMDNRQFLS